MNEVAGTNLTIGDLLRNRWSWWKETRQLLPLVFALSVIAVLLVVCNAIASQYFNWLDGRIEMPLLAIPGLFATGAGAVMVGYERDQGTMRWLSSLPIIPKALVLQKFALAVGGLLLMWVIALVLIGVMDGPSRLVNENGSIIANNWHQANIAGSGRYPAIMAYTFMILAAGFYSSWRIKNQFQSLLLLIACAVLPMVAMEICNQLGSSFGRLFQPDELTTFGLIFSLLLTFLFSVLGYRCGVDVLSPTPAPQVSGVVSAQPLPAKLSLATMPRFGTQLAPIIWQTWRHSRFVVMGLFALLVYSEFHMVAFAKSLSIAVVLLPFVGLFAVSWLAVLAFKDDGGFKKVRFFADRGINAGAVYWGRHLVGIAACSAAIAIYIPLVLNSSDVNISPLTVGMLCFWVYSISQLVSQVFRMTSVAVILAPIASGLMIGWLAVSMHDFDAPLWLVGMLGILPMLVTRIMMKRYMDGRDRPWSYLVGAAVLLVLMLTPLLPAGVTVMLATEMDPDRRASLLDEVAGKPHSNGHAFRLYTEPALEWKSNNDQFGNDPVGDLDRKEWNNSLSVKAFGTADLEMDDPPTQISDIKPWQRFLDLRRLDKNTALSAEAGVPLIDFDMQRVLAESTLKSDPALAIKNFRPWLQTVAFAIRGLRQSNALYDQEIADRLEIKLLDALESDLMNDYKDQDFYSELVGCLPSIDQRNRDRRRALLVTWRHWLENQENPELRMNLTGIASYRPKHEMGKYSFPRNYNIHAPRIADALQAGYVDKLIEILLVAIENGNRDDQWTRTLHEHLIGPDGFQAGPLSPRYRNFPAIQSVARYYTIPALFWGMQWESEIEKLRSSIINHGSEASDE